MFLGDSLLVELDSIRLDDATSRHSKEVCNDGPSSVCDECEQVA